METKFSTFSFKYVIPTWNIRCIKHKPSQYLLISVAGVRVESTR